MDHAGTSGHFHHCLCTSFVFCFELTSVFVHSLISSEVFRNMQEGLLKMDGFRILVLKFLGSVWGRGGGCGDLRLRHGT